MNKSFLEIDQYALDKEWLAQPSLFMRYSEHLADSRLAHDEAKASLDVVSAELDAQIRESPEDFGIPKITETAIRNCIAVHSKFQDANAELREARHAMDILSSAVSALEQRKRALECLVTLHGQSYFSEPRAKTVAGKEAIEETTKRSVRSGAKKRRARSEA